MISGEVVSLEVDEMIVEGWVIVKIYLNMVVKILMIGEGLVVVKVLIEEGIKINVIFVFFVI